MGRHAGRLAGSVVAAGLAVCAYGAAALPSVGELATRCCLNPAPHVHGAVTAGNKPAAASPGELLRSAEGAGASTAGPSAAPTAFQINLNASAALQANPAALAAFRRAATQWEARLHDPITVTIDAGLGALGADVIGATGAVVLQGEHNLVTEVLVLDAYDEGSNDAVVAALPSTVGFSQVTPAGTTNSGNILASKANFKAMGFEGLDQAFGASDGSVTFSSDFAFDYDNRDGVDPGKVDFETAAAHEIGHVLGFLSIVDFINAGGTDTAPFAIDLFRFPDNTADDPATLPQFRLNSRIAATTGNQIFDDLDQELAFSTGLVGPGLRGGDGYQASHWKADEFTGQFIGLMDPSLAFGEAYGVQESDLRALDLIGYDIESVVPEPAGAVALLGIGVIAGLRRRRA